MNFEWDEQKATSNLRKHNILFKNAMAIFLDSQRLIVIDDRFMVKLDISQ